MTKIILLLYFIPFFVLASSCPDEVETKAKYILNADVVSLVKVVGRKKGNDIIEYKFRTLEKIRGGDWHGSFEFPLNSRDITFYKGKDNTYSNHKNPVFWDSSVGVIRYSSGFGIVKEFELEKDYLIVFNSKKVESYAFEEIGNKNDDLWYQFVVDVVKGEPTYCNVSISVDDFNSLYIDEERYVFSPPKPPEKVILPGDNGKRGPGMLDIYDDGYSDYRKYAGFSVYNLSGHTSFKVRVPYDHEGIHDFSELNIFPKVN
ncbi:hypothetical protein [Motilimonas sp. E26]|uniref:hypothetical protein n=1 Tax=Motilimonas sp. E26 TaxID=2865674 RepID=UPI001E2BB7B8|nr:hypothetical protein [Motilimonas sp. E26]MCE0556148.1 hypothetical protein [Motilimonas sp. E26]